ncbi:flagellar motor switch protein FliM [Vallitalea sp.]|jgi:flagellar motor switch protein FliM|uniref:flagellar motor switch protein FliM n=1 Tax=Vallitalea sp. TaxID=1882829 RepID=UPI002600015D|nr:flagellar motor switch protein FliM [Vallitalea sp.]MCT4688235.1 flagellar motor switch protein FliM [Vallitalea sp.]
MGEVLSQHEIDDLLNALNTGELDVDEYRSNANEKQIKDYDFARPSKFSKEQLRTLEIIFEHYARLISTTLPAYLRTATQVDVVNSEAISYSEFANALSNPILLGVVDFSPLKGSFVVDLSVNIGYAIIDRLLGGKGEPLDRERDFSEIEVLLIEKILVICIQNMREPWKNVVELSPRLEKIETNSQFAQVISPTDVVALITLSIKIGPVEGLMNFCIPYLCLEPIMDKLNTKYWFSTIQKTNEELYKEIIEHQIDNVKIPIKAVLGKSSISVNDFVNLQKGDIIKLNNKVDSEMEVYVGNIKKFKGKPGIFNHKNAIKITSIIREEE